MLGLKLNHVSKRGHRYQRIHVRFLYWNQESGIDQDCKAEQSPNLIIPGSPVMNKYTKFEFKLISSLIANARELLDHSGGRNNADSAVTTNYSVQENSIMNFSTTILKKTKLSEISIKINGGMKVENWLCDKLFHAFTHAWSPNFPCPLQNSMPQTTSALTNMADLPEVICQPTAYMWTYPQYQSWNSPHLHPTTDSF